MKVALVGAELEENLGLRYMASALENKGHEVKIIPFNSDRDAPNVVASVIAFSPQITGLSMVFTSRAKEFCHLAQSLRKDGYTGHLTAGGPFASFNNENLLKDFEEFDSIALGEGEELICQLADNLNYLSCVPGLSYRKTDGSIITNPSAGNPENIDSLAFPKRDIFHDYFDKRIASILSSRGCWRNCAFCSINAWYNRVGGKKFRVRSVENLIAEIKELYFNHEIRIFNFQDDNFYLPNQVKALNRFKVLRSGLQQEGVEGIAIAIKARPDSITQESVQVLDDLGLFRVFLGVENASENGLRNLNRRQTLADILSALKILNEFDIHVAYNLLMFEPETVLDDILLNLRFMEKHIENPFNFCRAEAHAGTGLEKKIRYESRLLGDYFGFDYRLKDPRSEIFHQIANYSFFDRNFGDFGLHYFNMQVDYYFQLLRRFYPAILNQSLRAKSRNFVKETNLNTYQHLCEIYDFVKDVDINDFSKVKSFAREMRYRVDFDSKNLHIKGQEILDCMIETYQNFSQNIKHPAALINTQTSSGMISNLLPYYGLDSLQTWKDLSKNKHSPRKLDIIDLLNGQSEAIQYSTIKNLLTNVSKNDQ